MTNENSVTNQSQKNPESSANREIPEKLIDMKKLAISKNPAFGRFPLNMTMGFIRWLVCEEKVNNCSWDLRHYRDHEFTIKLLESFNVTTKVIGEENIPRDKRIVIVSNHPLGGFDGIIMMSIIGRYYPKFIFPVNDFLMNIIHLRNVFVPINKHGSNIQNMSTIEEAFNSDAAILYFPAGLCSRKIKGDIFDVKWEKRFLLWTRQSNRLILPAFMEGRNSSFFYNVAALRKKLGIKGNFEMTLLAKEFFNHKNKCFPITIGKAIDPNDLSESVPAREWAERLRKHTYALARDRNTVFDASL